MEKSVKLFTVELRDEAISLQRLSFRLQLCEGWNWVLYEWWRQVNCSTRCKNLSHHCHKLWLGAGKDSIYVLDFNFDHSYFINLPPRRLKVVILSFSDNFLNNNGPVADSWIQLLISLIFNVHNVIKSGRFL